MLHRFNDFFNNLVTRALEIWRRLVVPTNKGFNNAIFKVGPLVELQEVEPHKVIEVFAKHFIATEISAIIELSELKNDFNYFGFVGAAETIVLRSSENALNTLKHHLRANGVLSVIQGKIEFLMLLWDNQDSFKCL